MRKITDDTFQKQSVLPQLLVLGIKNSGWGRKGDEALERRLLERIKMNSERPLERTVFTFAQTVIANDLLSEPLLGRRYIRTKT